MTLAPPQHGLTDPTGGPATDAVVTAVLVLQGPASALDQTLDSLARQTRGPDRLVVVDDGQDGNAVERVRAHAGLAGAVPEVLHVTIPRLRSVSAAVRAALAETPHLPLTPRRDVDAAAVVPHVWVLTADSVAAPMTLARLLDAVRRSP